MELGVSARHSQWVGRYAKGMTVLGVCIMLGGVLCVAMSMRWLWTSPPGAEGYGWSMSWVELWVGLYTGVKWCVAGFLALALSQLLVYMVGPDLKPGWFLRKASGALFFLAGLSMIGQLVLTVSYLSWGSMYLEGASWATKWIAAVIWPLLASLGTALFYAALGFTLRRVLMVIEESKAVV